MESGERLRQDAAVKGAVGHQGHSGRHQEGSLEVRVGSGSNSSGNLPEDVGGPDAADEIDTTGAAHEDITGDLKDEDVAGGPADGDGSSPSDASGPSVDASRKGLADEDASRAVHVRRRNHAIKRVKVGRMHVKDGKSQHCRSGRRVASRVAEAVHLRRRGVGGRSSYQRKAGHGAGRDWRDADTAGDH